MTAAPFPLLPPIFARLQEARVVLLAGMGGGYDVYCGLPLLFALRALGKRVVLANLSFSSLERTTARPLGEALFEVTADTRADLRYFPELALARWLAARGEVLPVHALARVGVRPLRSAYRHLVETFEVDTVLLVNGGTDSLMRGDEEGLGTPEEDAASLAAVHALGGVKEKLLVCLGFGVDAFHGVSHGLVLEAIAALAREGASLGAWSLTPDMPEVRLYREALDYAHALTPDFPSVVSSSVLDAVEGRFGDHHATATTQGTALFVNPLMGLYWAFEADAVARRNLYLGRLMETETVGDVTREIEAFRATLPGVRPWTPIPH